MAEEDIEMYVIKRNGLQEKLSYKKIMERTKKIGEKFKNSINHPQLVTKIIDQLHNNIHTYEVDELLCQVCASLASTDYDYYNLASHLCISNHQKETSKDFINNYTKIYNNNGGYLSSVFMDIIVKHGEHFKSFVNYENDYLIDYFGFKTLERAYLMKHDGKILERIQHLWLRVAIQIHGEDLKKVEESYHALSNKLFIHATPTLFNSGTTRPQLSSCYLIGMEDDSIDGIFNTLHDCASISKWAGGIGLHIHNVRAKGSKIVGTNGSSNGLVPMLKVFNNTARYVDQCVVPGTYIYTLSGPKEIQYLETGVDQIYNEKGGLEVVGNVLEHAYSGNLLNISTMHSIEPLKITGEHPVLSVLNQPKGTPFMTIKNRLSKKLVQIEYNEANKLGEDSMIAYTIPQHSVDIPHITQDDCYAYGLMLGDGYLNNSNRQCSMTFNTHSKSEQIEFFKHYLTNKFIHYTISNNGMENGNTTKVIWTRGVDFPFKYGDLYNYHKEKSVCTRMINLPTNKVKYIVKGLLMSDGCLHKEVVFDSTSRVLIEQMRSMLMKMKTLSSEYKEVVFDSTSRVLIEQMRFMLMKMETLSSGYIRDGRGETHEIRDGEYITNQKISYSLRVPKTKVICELLNLDEPKDSFVKFLKYEKYLFTRVKSIETETYSGVLYDLQMKEEHNYMIHNGIIHNGGGKRSGSFAMYLEPWHADIEDFLELRKNHGDEEMRARDLFYALWIPDLFMKMVETDDYWYLMCPNKCKGLSDLYGEEFNEKYMNYVHEEKYEKKIKARELWFQICDSQMETGTPYMLYKDASNMKSNQKNLGVIKSSNLCTEIIEYSNKDETAVCNLASISLSSMVNETTKEFDYEKLEKTTSIVTENLNKIIDVNFYPTIKTKRSNFNHRPIGIGVQGLADAFAKMDVDFDSDEAQLINKYIFETIYYASLKKSNELSRARNGSVLILQEEFMFDLFRKLPGYFEWFIEVFKNNYYDSNFRYFNSGDIDVTEHVTYNYHKAKSCIREVFGDKYYKIIENYITTQEEKYGHNTNKYDDIESSIKDKIAKNSHNGAYSTFAGSPLSEGKFQFDLWGVEPSERYDWEELREDIIKFGVRNSLCVAPMPTASTSQILANNECFEPFTSNIYSRRTLAGEFVVINKYLMKELKEIGLWNVDIKNEIIEQKGSIQKIDSIPPKIKNKYKIVWDMSMKRLIDMAKERGAYICQSQSMNLWVEDPNYKNLTSMHFYAWRSGLKTGIYYLRRKAKHAAQQFTIEPTKQMSSNVSKENISHTQPKEDEVCEMCSA